MLIDLDLERTRDLYSYDFGPVLRGRIGAIRLKHAAISKS